MFTGSICQGATDALYLKLGRACIEGSTTSFSMGSAQSFEKGSARGGGMYKFEMGSYNKASFAMRILYSFFHGPYGFCDRRFQDAPGP